MVSVELKFITIFINGVISQMHKQIA